MTSCQKKQDKNSIIQFLRGELQILAIQTSDIYDLHHRLRKIYSLNKEVQIKIDQQFKEFGSKHSAALQHIQFLRAQLDRLRQQSKQSNSQQVYIQQILGLKKELSSLVCQVQGLKRLIQDGILQTHQLYKQKQNIIDLLERRKDTRDKVMNEFKNINQDLQTIMKRQVQANFFREGLDEELKTLLARSRKALDEKQELLERLKQIQDNKEEEELIQAIDRAQIFLQNLKFQFADKYQYNEKLKSKLLQTINDNQNEIKHQTSLSQKITQAYIQLNNGQKEASVPEEDIQSKIKALEEENQTLENQIGEYRALVQQVFLENNRISSSLQLFIHDDQNARVVLEKKQNVQNMRSKFLTQMAASRRAIEDNLCSST